MRQLADPVDVQNVFFDEMAKVDEKSLLQVCGCQMARYCNQDCQYRHWSVHKPVCKAARQPGGITREQALSFMLL